MMTKEPSTFLDRDDWADVRRLPAVFDRYEREELAQLEAGSHGKTAFLQLVFERRGDKTHLIRNFTAGHQVVRRVMYMDTELEDMAVVLIMQNSSGLLQGDRIRTEIVVGDGARVLVTTQSAAKIYKMEHNYATQRLDITVGKDAYAEVLLDPMIPYVGARLYNEINIEVDPSSTLIFGDHITPGRVAHGEEWAYDLMYSRMQCRRPDGRLTVADTNVLAPKAEPLTTPGLYGHYSDMGMLYVIAEHVDALDELADQVHDVVQGVEGMIGSASVLPAGVGVHARVLGESTNRTGGIMHECWRVARRSLLGVGVPPIYRVKYGFEPTITYQEGRARQ